VERVHLVYHLHKRGSLLLGELAVLLRSNYETNLSHKVEGVFNLGLDVDLGCLLDLFGLRFVHTCVAGVGLNVEFDEFLDLLDVGLHCGLSCHHFFLAVVRYKLSLLDRLLCLDDLVKLFLLVAQFTTLSGDEQVSGGREIELELALLAGLRGFGAFNFLLFLAHFKLCF
jgi:hypothetical protein